MNSLNIVKQRTPSCRGEHADTEFYLIAGRWELADSHGCGPIIETLHRMEQESDESLFSRAVHRSNEIDREMDCSRCYR